MGPNFLATGIGGALSGVSYTWLYGWLRDAGHPEQVWYVLGVHFLLGILVLNLFVKAFGEFREQEA